MEKDNQQEEFELMLREIAPQYDLIEDQDIKFFMAKLPKALDKEVVKRLLLEFPQQITFLDIQAAGIKEQIGNAKVALKGKKNLLEIEKSEVRKRELDRFQEDHAQYMNRTQALMMEIMQSKEQNASLKKAYLQEVSRVMKPERPTKADLDDIANIKTKWLQTEIDNLEQQINDLQLDLDLLGTKKDFYNNLWVTVRAYKGIIVEELRMLPEQ